MVIIDLPFKENPDGWHCAHVAIDSVAKHFLKNTYSPSFINALMSPKSHLWVWPFQVAKTLDKLGLFVRLMSPVSPKVVLTQKDMPQHYVERTHHPSLKESVSYVMDKDLYEKKALSVEDLEALIYKGRLVIIVLGSKNHFGKYALMTGYDKDKFYYHDSGPENAKANKAISKEEFMSLWSEDPSKNTAIVVYGKKSEGTFSKYHF